MMPALILVVQDPNVLFFVTHFSFSSAISLGLTMRLPLDRRTLLKNNNFKVQSSNCSPQHPQMSGFSLRASASAWTNGHLIEFIIRVSNSIAGDSCAMIEVMN